jgi:hypothetical protein
MNLRIEIGAVFFLLFVTTMRAQFPEAPKFVVHQWKTPCEFDAALDTVKALAKWLCDTPISWQFDVRSSANVYVLNWMTTHPSRKWDLDTHCFGPLDDHLELMYTFLHANLYFSLVHEKASEMSRDVYVLQMLSKKILWSEKYKGEDEWQQMVKAVQKGKEKKYLAQCQSKTKQPVG